MIGPTKLLAGVPQALRDDLINRFREIGRNYLEHRWEPAELNGGKFAEAAYSIVLGAITGTYPAQAGKPKDFSGSCRALEARPANSNLPGDRSLRVLIPRQLVGLYEIRNNRGVGHVGGDVNPNAMDATAVFATSSWVLAELVRVFHACSIAEAQRSVDQLAQRAVPAVWIVPGRDLTRVLHTGLSASSQTLLLLHIANEWVPEATLCACIEYARLADYRNKVLRPLHKKRLIEFDAATGRAHLTPLGAMRVETFLT
jgi:hypothetical protein